MTAKKYLSRLFWLEKEVKAKREELLVLKSRAEGLASPNLSGMPSAHSGNDKIADSISRIVDAENKLNAKIDSLIKLQSQISAQIDSLETVAYRVILNKRYVCCMDWLSIADEIGYSPQRCYQLHGEALREFTNLYLKD